jgi:hypothetical protein
MLALPAAGLSLCISCHFTAAAPSAEPTRCSQGGLYVTYITDVLAKNRPKTGRMKPFCRNRETFLKQTRRISLANTGRQRRPGGIT